MADVDVLVGAVREPASDDEGGLAGLELLLGENQRVFLVGAAVNERRRAVRDLRRTDPENASLFVLRQVREGADRLPFVLALGMVVQDVCFRHGQRNVM